MPAILFPKHTVVRLTPSRYGWREERFDLSPPSKGCERLSPAWGSRTEARAHARSPISGDAKPPPAPAFSDMSASSDLDGGEDEDIHRSTGA